MCDAVDLLCDRHINPTIFDFDSHTGQPACVECQGPAGVRHYFSLRLDRTRLSPDIRACVYVRLSVPCAERLGAVYLPSNSIQCGLRYLPDSAMCGNHLCTVQAQSLDFKRVLHVISLGC